MDISNGTGIGISLFVQGCHFHCKGCFNQETWDFNGGKEWTTEIENQFIKLANRSYIKRISFLGGEPLADENIEIVFRVIQKLKSLYPEKQIWIYTGYTWENIINLKYQEESVNKTADLSRLMAVRLADVVADGQFKIEQQDINHKKALWVGSLNQRVIDVKKSFDTDNVVLYSG